MHKWLFENQTQEVYLPVEEFDLFGIRLSRHEPRLQLPVNQLYNNAT